MIFYSNLHPLDETQENPEQVSAKTKTIAFTATPEYNNKKHLQRVQSCRLGCGPDGILTMSDEEFDKYLKDNGYVQID